MNETLALVSRIVASSLVDGPGNRMAVFFQGCNLRCIACHNPHTIGTCSGCSLCVANCPSQALTALGDTPPTFDADRCQRCDRCVENCPIHANPQAVWMGVSDIVTKLRRAAPFLSGITASGGEATLQHEFLRALFSAIKSEPSFGRLTTMVDSNGMATQPVWHSLIPVLDYAAIDLKAFSRDVHLRLTGESNELVLQSIAVLHQARRLLEVRILVVAGYNDSDDEVRAAGGFLACEAPEVPVRLIPFRKHGVRPEYQRLAAPGSTRLQAMREGLRALGTGPVRIG